MVCLNKYQKPLIFSLFLLVWLLLVTIYPSVYAQSYHFKQYTTKDGLSNNSVTSMMRDSRGFLWIGTINGLNRFDGKNFKIYRHNRNEETSISDNFIHSIFEDKTGAIWITTRNGGINRFDTLTGTFTNYLPNNHSQNGILNSPANLLFEDNKQRHWISFMNGSFGLFNPSNGHYYGNTIVDKESGKPIKSCNSIIIFNDGSMLVSAFQKIYYIHAKEAQNIGYNQSTVNAHVIPTPYTLYGKNIIFSTVSSDGTLWIDTMEQLLKINSKYLPKNVQASIQSGVRQNVSANEFTIRDNHIITGSKENQLMLTNIKTGDKKTFAPESNKLTRHARLYVDSENMMWLQTWGAGFFKISEQTFVKKYTQRYGAVGLPSNFILAFEEEHNEGIWIGTSKGLAFFDTTNGKTRQVTSNSIWSLYRDSFGLWISTRSAGIQFIAQRNITPNISNKTNLIQKTVANSFLPTNNIMQVVKDRRGWLWIGSEQGIQILKNPREWILGNPGDVLKLPSIRDELLLSSRKIRKIYEDKTGNMWVATKDAGFNRIVIKNKKLIEIEAFLPNPNSRNAIAHNDARSIYQQNDSTYWFATYGGGLTRWTTSDNTFTHLNIESGLPDNSCYSVLPDPDSLFIWTSTNNGLARINTKTLNVQHYTAADGLQNNEFNTGAYHRLTSGKLLFGGISGFNIVNPKNISTTTKFPPVYITNVNLFNNPINTDTNIVAKKKLNLSHRENFLSFEFAALDYRLPVDNMYAYMMEGIDEDWVQAGKRNYASYPNLNPGRYTFKVQASNSDDVWSEQFAAMHVVIHPPWWSSLWFRILTAFIALISFIFAIKQISQRKLRKQLKKLEIERKLQEERERISRDLHDNVGAQLTNITSGLSLVDKYTDRKNLNDTKRLVHQLQEDVLYSMKQLRETIWALNQNEIEIKMFKKKLQDYFSTLTCFNEKIEVAYDICDEDIILSPTKALNLYRIIQEAAQNTLKYSGADHFSIQIKKNKSTLTLIIKDNGVFKNPDKTYPTYGVSNMQKRVKHINGSLKIFTKKGTTIKINIPA